MTIPAPILAKVMEALTYVANQHGPLNVSVCNEARNLLAPFMQGEETPALDMDEDRSVLFELGRQEVEKEFRTKNLQQRVAYVLDMFRPESAISEISRQAALTQGKEG